MQTEEGTFRSHAGIFIDPTSTTGDPWRLRNGAIVLDEMNRADLDRCIGELYPLLSGSVDFIVDGLAASLPLIESGQVRPLAKLNNRPVTRLPDLQPLAVEADLPQLGEMSTWVGLLAPAGTPSDIVEKIQREVVRIYADPDVLDKLDRAGITPMTTTPAEFDDFFRAEAVRWSKVFKESGIKLD